MGDTAVPQQLLRALCFCVVLDITHEPLPHDGSSMMEAAGLMGGVKSAASPSWSMGAPSQRAHGLGPSRPPCGRAP